MKYDAYVFYDAKHNQILSYANMTREEAQRRNRLIPAHNHPHPYLIWILLPAFWSVL